MPENFQEQPSANLRDSFSSPIAPVPQSSTAPTGPPSDPIPHSARRAPPSTVPDHELLRCIGRGSYGDVWLARNIVGTWRAVKIIRRQTFERDEHFEREFKGIQKFEPISRSHEGLVDILQIGRNDAEGYFYYVMELADPVGEAGEKVGKWESEPPTPVNDRPLPVEPATYKPKTLRSLLSPAHFPTCSPGRFPARLPVADCVRLGLALTAALEHLHKQGLVHRDIKPSNIIFVNGAPKLADVGLVAEVSEAKSLVGTVGYIPPEGPGSAQADLFSLGKVLYEMVTGKDRQDFPALPPEFREQLGIGNQLTEFNEILLKACESDPRHRYASARALHNDLALLQHGQSVIRKHTRAHRLKVASQIGLGAAAVLVLVASGWLLSRVMNPPSDSLTQRLKASSPPSPTEIKSVAVLPFNNDSPDKADEYLAASMADEISNALAKVPGLRVLGRTTAAALKTAKDRRATADQFDLSLLLDGRVRKEGDRLHVAAQLIDAARDRVIWSEVYTGEMKDAFGIQSDIAQKAFQAAGILVTDTVRYRLALKSTRNWEAYQSYLEARHWWGLRTAESVKKAAELGERAIALDTNFACAYAVVADCYSVLPDLWGMSQQEAWPKARAAARRAIELEDNLAEAHTSLGKVMKDADWDWTGAEREFKRAIELDPNNPTARQWYSQLLNTLQRPEEAIAQIRKAIDLDPQSNHLLFNLVFRYYYARRFDDAIATWRKTLAIDPKKVSLALLWIYESKGLETEAIPLWETQLASTGLGSAEFPVLRNAHRIGGMKVYWEKQLELCLSRPERNLPAHTYYNGYICAYLGRDREAFDWLERACEERNQWMAYLGADPFFDRFRSNPRFIALLKRIGLQK